MFRAHLDGSVTGFVAWDRQDPITPGKLHTLRWLTGATSAAQSFVAIEIWAAHTATSGRWESIEGGTRVPNTRKFNWIPPMMDTPPLMRVRVLGELGVEHVSQMMLS